MKRYLFDENVLSKKIASRPTNYYDVKDIAEMHGLDLAKTKSIADSDIVYMVLQSNYTVVTRDRGLAMNLIVRNKEVVFINDSGIFIIKPKIKRIEHIEELS